MLKQIRRSKKPSNFLTFLLVATMLLTDCANAPQRSPQIKPETTRDDDICVADSLQGKNLLPACLVSSIKNPQAVSADDAACARAFVSKPALPACVTGALMQWSMLTQ